MLLLTKYISHQRKLPEKKILKPLVNSINISNKQMKERKKNEKKKKKKVKTFHKKTIESEGIFRNIFGFNHHFDHKMRHECLLMFSLNENPIFHYVKRFFVVVCV